MNFCPNCGTKIQENAAFCVGCGAKIGESQETVNTAVETPAQSTPAAPVNPRPAHQLKTNRGLIKYILLSAITFGIYGLVAMSSVSSDINTIASRYDGKKTMHYCLVFFIFSWLTCGIVPIVWTHKISYRIGQELERRGIDYGFGASTYWGWGVLGSLIWVGPFIYVHKFFKAMNLLSADYNVNG